MKIFSMRMRWSVVKDMARSISWINVQICAFSRGKYFEIQVSLLEAKTWLSSRSVGAYLHSEPSYKWSFWIVFGNVGIVTENQRISQEYIMSVWENVSTE